MSSPLGENATLRPVAAKKPKEKEESVEAEEDDDSKIFPQKLMEILADEKNHESICWLPHGRAFTIRDRKLFAETVMPRCFSRKAKYSSFTRKLNRWNFSRVSRGPEAGAYYHKFFLRDKPHHAAQMFCKNARSKLAMASTTSVDIERAQQPPLKQAEDTSSAGVANALEHPQQLGRQAPLPSQVQPPLPSSALLSAPAFQKLGFKERYEEQHSDQKQKQNNEIDLKSSLTPFASGGNSLQLLERQLQILQIEQTNRLMLEQVMSLQRQRQWQQGSSDAATSVAQLEQQQQLAQLQKSSKAVQFLQMRHFMQMQNRNQQARKPTKRGASAA